MNKVYADWIAENYPDYESTYGQCIQATKSMTKAFPELRTAKGFLFDAQWGRRQHMWCVAQDGSIVDPTKKQFPCPVEYDEVLPGDESRIPTGVRMDCGDDVYNGDTFCSEECEMATRAYLGV